MFIKKYLWIVLAPVVILGVTVFLFQTDNKNCCLCQSQARHAPVLVNFSTGELLELSVYDADPFRPGALAEEQRTGYFTFVKGAGASGYREGGQYVKVTIQLDKTCATNRYFCKNCRAKLTGHNGYALVDLINPGNPIVIPIRESLDIRCYEIIVCTTDHKQEILIKGKK